MTEKARQLMSRYSGPGDLIQRPKEEAVPALKLRKVAGILATGPGGNDTHQLLYELVRSRAREYEDLVAGLPGDRDDPIVARLALQALRTVWGLADHPTSGRAMTGPAHAERSTALCRAFAQVAKVFGTLRGVLT